MILRSRISSRSRGPDASLADLDLIKILLASLVVGTILTHFGITAEHLAAQVGLSQERAEELARQALAWALPNVALGAMIIVPIWFLVFLLRPPRRSSD